ncbi:hypothetical protein QUA81_15060 [Microcoleus sp. F6_B4]
MVVSLQPVFQVNSAATNLRPNQAECDRLIPATLIIILIIDLRKIFKSQLSTKTGRWLTTATALKIVLPI